jgi:hypothetical protein
MAGFIFGLIIIIIALATELRNKSKEVERYQKDWQFCKKLLDECRAKTKE